MKLHKVIKKVLTEKETQELLRTLQLFQGWIKSRGLTTKGPLITLSSPIVEDGITRIQTSLLSQLVDVPHRKPEYPYFVIDELRVDNCLYTRFCGDQTHIVLAHSKINVYAYENFMTVTGNTYTVFLADNDGAFTADIFAEVRNDA